MKRSIGIAALGLAIATMTATAQDMMRHVDLSSPDMASAEMPREGVGAALAAATGAAPADFTGKRLSGLDLSGLNLSGAIFRAARLNKTKLAGARLDRAILDQAWLLEADLTGASLKGANLFARRWFAPAWTAPISREHASLPISPARASSEPRSQEQIWALTCATNRW